ncbi:MAG TPA: pilus assembly protein TadG-related protein [Tepidisphaeraceae bacterium]|jgi:Flp pilus assembly protein TadG
MNTAKPNVRTRLASRRHGAALIYMTIGMVVFAGFISLAIDVAHVWVVHSELQQAADAAVRYGLAGLANGVSQAQGNAVAAANDNIADGTPVTLNPNTDIDFGTWSSTTQTFTVLTGAAQSTANAIRVRANRTSANGNAVSCFFGSVIGIGSADAHATAIGAVTGGYGLVGLAGITLGGNASIGYWSPTGATSNHGSIASNGNINLGGSTYIQGDARPGPGMSVNLSGSASVTGSTNPLLAPLSYPNATAGSAATSNNDSAAGGYWNSGTNDFNFGGSANLTLPGGVYYFHNFNTGGQTTLNFSGPATVYVTGNVSILGATVTSGNQPKNLSIQVIGNGWVNVGSNASFYANIYAPQSPVTLSGKGAIYGSVLGWSINMTGTSNIYYDLSLPGGWNITTVQ